MVVAVWSTGKDHASVLAPMSATKVASVNMLVPVTSDTGFKLGRAVTLAHEENILVAVVATGIEMSVMLGAVVGNAALANILLAPVTEEKGPGIIDAVADWNEAKLNMLVAVTICVTRMPERSALNSVAMNPSGFETCSCLWCTLRWAIWARTVNQM